MFDQFSNKNQITLQEECKVNKPFLQANKIAMGETLTSETQTSRLEHPFRSIGRKDQVKPKPNHTTQQIHHHVVDRIAVKAGKPFSILGILNPGSKFKKFIQIT